jgi:L-lactate dehydrogenase complex protein LldF
MHLSPETFDQNARAALCDPQLRGALRNLAETFGERRKLAIATVSDWEGLREQARRVKAETLLHLDKYLADFAGNATRAGACVHWARDAGEACSLIINLLRERDAKRIVKSKSMTTEEIHLNAALEKAGYAPVETDLGEWIVQLADEMPSHIVVPAIHKSKKQIAELFVDKVGIAPTDDVDELTKTARVKLREEFARADVGISGVNFAVAETGTFLILENEGNARLTTSLPKTHIAVMGIEKVIPRLADLDVFLKLLPRSGTGQQLTAYQSLITGTSDEGPAEVHIVIMDNGRSRMLAHPVTRQSLACIRCGACLNACPVYQNIGGHAYGAVYPGPIGAVITPQLNGLEKNHQLPFASSLCGACKEVCPVKIDIPELLLHLRSEIKEGQKTAKKSLSERLAFRLYALMCSHQRLYEWGGRLARVFQPAAKLAPPLAAWSKGRETPEIAARSFREQWKDARD